MLLLLCCCFKFQHSLSSVCCRHHIFLFFCCSFRFPFELIFLNFLSHYTMFYVTTTMSASAFSSRSFNFFRFHSNIFVFLRMHVGTSPSMCLRLCLHPPFHPHIFVFFFFACLCLLLTTHGHPFHSSSDSQCSTAYSRRDEFFFIHFSIVASTPASNVLAFVVLERSASTCFDRYLSVYRHVSCRYVHLDLNE